jgi:CheY-like chemotaxis protein
VGLNHLLSERCSVVTASTGESGLEKARRFKPNVLLLDLAMPGKSGFEVAAAVRKMPDLKNALIIAMTGFGDAETAKQVAASGFDAHLTKPVAFKELSELIERFFSTAK